MGIKNEFARSCLESLLYKLISIKKLIRHAEVDLWDFGYGYSFLIKEYYITLEEYLRVRDIVFGIIDCNDVKLVGRR
ncbi:MAG: hypothetical protein GF317_03575 [Candidatus Lokiarchaeota archaeon]|nr:hypothetical protein [Candidatus Lokiarchaeota archaeon]